MRIMYIVCFAYVYLCTTVEAFLENIWPIYNSYDLAGSPFDVMSMIVCCFFFCDLGVINTL